MSGFLITTYWAFIALFQQMPLWQSTAMLTACLGAALTAIFAATGWRGAAERWQIKLFMAGSYLIALAATLPLLIVAHWVVSAYVGTERSLPSIFTCLVRLASGYSLQLEIGLGCGLAMGVLAWFIMRFYMQPRIARYLGCGSTDDFLTDARTIESHLPKPFKYDPRKYFKDAQRKGNMFLGIDERRRVVALPRDTWKKTHVQICGPTGTGKGVMAGVCLAQSVAYGDGVYVIDPKNDEFAASVLSESCAAAGKPFHLVDLQSGQPAQFDLLKNISKEDLNSLFIAGFALGEKGTDADFYRKNDRAAARYLAGLANQGSVSLALLAERAGVMLPEDLVEKCEGFRRSLEEIAELQAPQASPFVEAIDLDGPLKNGGCLYVVGSMDDEAVVILQKMLLVRIVQLISARRRNIEQRHITIFADEIRYLMSKKLGDVLGSVRDKGCNVILAHQSLDDLQTGDVSSPAVVIDNTGLRWLYRSTTEEMATWIAGQTGKIVVNKTTRHIEENATGGKISRTEHLVAQIERQKIDINMVQHLPNGVAVVVGAGPARLAFTSPVPVSQKLDSSQLVRPAASSRNVGRIERQTKRVPNKKDDAFSEFLEDGEGAA